MKKNYTRYVLVTYLLLILCAAKMSAQPLVGNYSIDDTQPASAVNFTSFTAFASAINANGVAGPVIVDVGLASGPYTEAVAFTQASGVSATNSVTVRGHGRVLTHAGVSGTRHTLALNGADHMFFHDLDIRGTGSSYALTVKLYNQADSNQFHGCEISSPMTGTSSYLVPFSISGSGTSATSSGNSGSANIVSTCTITGGYYNTVIYGNSGSLKSKHNEIRDSYIRDFYAYGVYNAYAENTLIKGNVIERPNRTSVTTGYGIMLTTGSFEGVVDGNHIRRMFDGNLTSGSAMYAIYIGFSGTSNRETRVINNIVSDNTNRGTHAGVYVPGYSNVWIQHNTISIDSQNTTSETTYAIYYYVAPGKIQNNIISVTRTGTGTHYGLYLSSEDQMEVDGNVYNITATTGYIGYYSGAVATFSAWQQANGGAHDQNGFEADPLFANPGNMDYTPTNTVINNGGISVGIAHDHLNSNRSVPAPDPGAIEIFNFICGGMPLSNAVSLPQLEVCPGMSLNAMIPANIYTNSGITYQWQSSKFAIGGFTNIAGADKPKMTFSPTEDTYYTVVITCTNGGGSVTATPALFDVASTTTNNVPYHESFESLGINNLPNCSWATSDMVEGKAEGTTLTQTTTNTNGRFPRTGSQFASFYYNPAGTNYFYSNGIQLKAGITYSASLWFVTEHTGYTNWSDLSILVGTSQSPTGLQTIVSTNGPATSNIYKNLSDTFEVATDGIYYIAVRATAQGSGAQFLTWDDLSITMPCEVNSPALTMIASQTTVCAGFPIHLHANGATSYTWNTGEYTANIAPLAPPVISPGNFSYVVTGADPLTGCTSTLAQNIWVEPSPQVLAIASDPMICAGEEVTLSGLNAAQYVWAHGPQSPVTSVKPNITTTYSVNGIGANGCYKLATVQVVVNPKPAIGAQVVPAQICAGETATLTGLGGVTYTWVGSNSAMHIGHQVSITPASSTVYHVSGTDGNGCTNMYEVVVVVDVCAGLDSHAATAVNIYPNPATDLVNIESAAGGNYYVMDVLGKVVLQGTIEHGRGTVSLGSLPAGLYYVRLATDDAIHTSNVIKQ